MPLDDQKELFVVVDRNDKIIGYRTRYECHHNIRLIHRAVGVILFNSEKQILLQKRSMKKDVEPGKYTISASGHVNKGETYKSAAERELWEEIGVRTNIVFAKKFLGRYVKESEMEVIYKAFFNGPFHIDSSEVEMVTFYSVEEIKEIKHLLTVYAVKSLKQMDIL